MSFAVQTASGFLIQVLTLSQAGLCAFQVIVNPVVCAATVDIFLSGISSGEDMLVICNVTAVTMDDRRRIIGDAGIAIDGQKIAAVDSAENIRKRYPDADLLDGAGMIAIPGLIDTHAHADQSLLRGLGDNMHWMPFLDDVVEPYLAKRDPADGVLANALSIMEMIHSGTTCFVSPNVDPRDDYASLTNVIGDLGIRAVLGRFTMPDAGPDSEGVARDTVAAAASVMHRWHATQKGLVSMWFGLMVPRRPGDTDHPAFYRAVANEAREMGVGIVYHFCSEIEDSRAKRVANQWLLGNAARNTNSRRVGHTPGAQPRSEHEDGDGNSARARRACGRRQCFAGHGWCPEQ
jgi:cytosine/adenosine deaminase-related metal-dependent hydrolase